MGNIIASTYYNDKRPEYLPARNEKPSHDSEYGFPAPRKPRVAKISEQELKALHIPKKYRDYCAHLIKDILVCERMYKPFTGMCKPEYRAYEHCEVDDYILRMKEYEREKRLRLRELKKQKKMVSDQC